MGPLRIALPARLTRDAVSTITQALRDAHDASVIMLVGTGDAFCLGMDFASVLRLADSRATAATIRDELDAFADCLLLLLQMAQPTLSVVEGPALGGGLGLAAACDFVLATSAAQFGLPEALYGFAPSIIRPALLTRLSHQQLNLLLFTGHARTADEAARLGLVDRIVNLDKLEFATREIVRHMTRANRQSVAIARGWDVAELSQAIRNGVAETAAALARPDVVSALRKTLTEDGIPWQT